MQLPSVLAFIALLVSFPLTMHAQNVPNDYIIKERPESKTLRAHREVYSADGKVAYTFCKQINFPSQYKNMATIADSSLKPIFSMVSSDDQCRLKTHYAQLNGPAAKDTLLMREYKHDNSRAFGKNLWHFNFYSDAVGARVYYKFEQNHTNKGGRIYKVAAAAQKKHDNSCTSAQLRRDKWLDPVNGTKTFTLSCIDGAPMPELVALLGLVFFHC
ncbi:hypothetical protein PGTUg99_024660 [Puccinia graminis f. sp. tritici]|uniref:Uncharacterized protein n=1 Tax=Puccinia graminis f. sp. tritici TaxID=56615 RepID=A0A5B0Q3Y5_PUCGR|nr:hypothetical protein PGTUg99_024660 [Puccinia graminis f. sp. tritici]